MPELTIVNYGLLAVMLIVGAILGWVFRSDRCAKEKIAVNAGWQKELESQQGEHDRLAGQNKSLMEQISQYQASQKDYSNRARELAESLKEAFAQRDQLQRQIKEIRGNLEVAIAQRDQFQSSLQNQQSKDNAAALKDKDHKIFRLSRELTSWQSRVPPLVERFQAKNREVQELAEELEKARREIARLEELTDFDQTRIEPMDTGKLPDGGDASNEPNAMTAAHDTSALQADVEADDDTAEEDASGETLAGPEESDTDDAGAALIGTDSDEAPVENDTPDPAGADASEKPGDLPGSHAGDADESGETDMPPGDGTDDADEEIEFPVDDGDRPDGQVKPQNASDDGAGIEADDLKMIKGIGPSIEKTLNGLGIHSFQQIADMSEFEIDRVAQQLRGFRSRIYREDWIGQARDLHYDQSNQRS